MALPDKPPSDAKWVPISTERLLLREFREEDEEDIHEYGGDPEVSKYTDWGPNARAQTGEVLAERLRAQRIWPRAEVDLAVELVGESKVIGSVSLRLAIPGEDTASFGYTLNRRYWNSGYTTEACRALLRVAFETLELHRVWATCDARNIASSRVMEKLGMRREAQFRRDVFQKGEWRDSYLYAMLESEWRTY